jgi:glycopeptide antibiotics resistance protein
MAFIKFRDILFGRWASMVITFCGLLLVLLVTLSPYDFDFKEMGNSMSHDFILLGWGESNVLDVLQNVMLFLPFGFGVTGYIMHMMKLEGLTSLITTILVSFGLSYVIEVLQVFQPSRFPSLIDILSNGAGGIIGFLCFLLLNFKFKAIDYNSAITVKTLQLIFLGYAIFAILISIPIQHFSSLSNWDKTFPLLLGNERTGDRPWQGYVSELFIADRAFSETEVAHISSKKDSIALLGNSLLASYLPERRTQSGQLSGIGRYRDKMGHLPDLVLRGEPQDVQQDKGAFLDSNHWLETAASTEYLTQRIAKTSQFTLGATVATSETMQTGPARIISLSEDPSHRNFTLGQDGSDLVFRLRTPTTGKNGVFPVLIVPDVFATTSLHNFVITYDGSTLLLYVDEVRNSHSLELNPGVILFCSLIRLSTYSMVGYKAMHYVYYALIFIPLGILITHTVKIMKSRFFIKVIIICGGIMVPSLILEGILVIVSGKDVSLENLLISVIFMTGPIVFLRYISTRFIYNRSTQRSRDATKI